MAIVLGDRVEMLQQAIRYVDARVPLLHIHGGEHTYGSLDERWRWAMTAIADWHCVAHTRALGELMSKGRVRFSRIVVTGAPGLDGITDRQPWPNAPRIVVLYNPAIDAATTVRESEAIGEAIRSVGVDSTWLYIKPNGDRFADCIPWHRAGDEMDSERFRDLLAAAHVIVGNSSAGIIEAPSLGTWTVNVGERQAGRPRAGSVMDVAADPAEIRLAITDGLKLPRSTFANPYGDGSASPRIRDVLLGMAK